MSRAPKPLLTAERVGEPGPAESYGSVSRMADIRSSQPRRWFKPSPIWILVLSATAAISTSGVVAPRIEIYTRTICQVYGLDAASNECLTDRTVQAAVARLITVLTTTSGLLATLTTAWWGSLSDCYGRIWVLGFNVAGLMVSDTSFLTVAYFWDRLPGTYWWYVVGPAVEGIVGGISVASVIMHAYISDCSDPGQRSRAFSQLMGLLFFGMSVGPLLGGFIMRATHHLFPVFYVTTTIDALVSLSVWFVIPESLSPERRAAARAQRADPSASGAGIAGTLRRWGSAFDVVSPLSVLLPTRVETQGKGRAVDWSLTILGAAYGFGTLVQASLASVYQQVQYASFTYGWTSETINYWMGGVSVSKAVYLTLLFPTIVKLLTYLRSRPAPDAISADETEPLLPPTEPDQPPLARAPTKLLRAASLDLLLARAAVVTDMIFYALTPTAVTGALFAAYGMCISLGASFGPVMQSLALDLYARRGGADTGRLLGALTVVSALSSHIIGPTLFGVTYMKTVATLPGAIYLLCCASLFRRTAFAATAMTRPPGSRDVSRLRQDDLDVPSRSRSRPGSRPSSRPRGSRNTTASSIQLLPQGPDDLMVPGGSIGEETAELLHEFVHPHHDSEETLAEDGEPADGLDEEEEEYVIDHAWREKLPWWKRPSPWWFLGYVPFAAIAMTVTAAAKIELYTYLACEMHKPTVNPDQDVLSFLSNGNATYKMTFDHPDQRVCHADPVVSAAVAELNIIMTTAMGILSCMTTAWWGSVSDRYGRTRVMSLAVIGILLTDLTFIAVFYFYKQLPGGYYFLITGPVLEGLLGGLTSMSANVHAYMSDCSPPSQRSRVFSRYLGLLFTGMAIGPTLGGLSIRLSGTFISVFFIAAGLHFIYALLIWFVIPESLSPAEMRAARGRHAAEEETYRAAHAHGGAMVLLKRMFAFLTPLLLFVPVEIGEGGSPAKGKRRDWSLCLVVAAYGFTISLMGSYVYFMQYIQTFFQWDTEQVGYWFSAVGVTRAIFLTAILPLILKFVAPTPPPIQLPTEPSEPLNAPSPIPDPDTLAPPSQTSASRSASPRRSPSRHGRTQHNHHHHHPHTPAFDLALARVSLFLDALVYLGLTIAPNGLVFAATSCMGAFGMGFGPAIQSVALTLYNQRGGQDTGKLFGAMSVVQALSAQIFGPFVYGVTYAKTVATFPKAIFFVAAGAVVTSCVLLAFVRLPRNSAAPLAPGADVEEQLAGAQARAPARGGGEEEESGRHPEREETLVGEGAPLIVLDDGERGRQVLKPFSVM
ncbi:MFS general substrate transporter [Trametes coccinea BRFM310]|uniref:MFS general substrate transporter n=1 Tax=Trametes coccinea (strain BRFM310) TaxID=1353009 RepID=A0A1Y2J5D1_TRAC3|nr:MFS general substrate transporter [Trametes coccinea BRFM310]